MGGRYEPDNQLYGDDDMIDYNEELNPNEQTIGNSIIFEEMTDA